MDVSGEKGFNDHGRASRSAWLYTIARNTALSTLRSESYRKTLPIERHEPSFDNWKVGSQRMEMMQLVERMCNKE